MQHFIDVFAHHRLEQNYFRIQKKTIWQIMSVYAVYVLVFYQKYPTVLPILLLVLPVYAGGCTFLLFIADFFKTVQADDRQPFFESIFPFEIELPMGGDRHIGIGAMYLFGCAWILFCITLIGGLTHLHGHFFILAVFCLLMPLLGVLFFLILLHLFYLCFTVLKPE